MTKWTELEAKLNRKKDKISRLQVKIDNLRLDLGILPKSTVDHYWEERPKNIKYVYEPIVNYKDLPNSIKVKWDKIFNLYIDNIIHNDLFILERYTTIPDQPKNYMVTKGTLEHILEKCHRLDIVPEYLYTKDNINRMPTKVEDGYYYILESTK